MDDTLQKIVAWQTEHDVKDNIRFETVGNSVESLNENLNKFIEDFHIFVRLERQSHEKLDTVLDLITGFGYFKKIVLYLFAALIGLASVGTAVITIYHWFYV